MDPFKPKQFRNSRESRQTYNDSSKIRRLSSLAQLAKTFNRRNSRVGEECEEPQETNFDAMPIIEPQYPQPSSGARPSTMVPNFSHPMSARRGKHESGIWNFSTSYPSHKLGLPPRSSTFSHLPKVDGSEVFPWPSSSFLLNSHTKPSLPSRPKQTSPQRSFLPVRVSPKRGQLPNIDCSIPPKAYHDLIEPGRKESRAGTATIHDVVIYDSLQKLNKPSESKRVDGVTWTARISLSLKSRSTDEAKHRDEDGFHSSAYWTGRFMALNDIYMNTCWCDPKSFDTDSPEASRVLDVDRCRAVFIALEVVCVTPEARNDLEQFRLQFARIKNMPELVSNVSAPGKSYPETDGQMSTMESSSASSQDTAPRIDLDEILASSSVSTTSMKSFNQMPADFTFPPRAGQHEDPSSPQADWSVGNDLCSPGKGSQQLQKVRRASFVEKLLGKTKRSGITEM